MIELLAPAGSMESLRAAVQNGANAVYLGCGNFNARQSAKNFTPATLAEAVKYCHVRGVAVHLTLNTLVLDREIEDLTALIRHAAQCGVDAFIVQDLGVVQLCRQIAPGVEIHGSTQMTIHSLPGVMFCAALGMQRVVLSRELNREEIRYICANSPIQIEIFGHGALCMCYSGQCYLSSIIGCRSGNRGRCAQPCRQTYGFSRWEDKYPLSLKDNCLVTYLKELEDMGIASLKLEGRMKRPEYVAAVTGVYRKALDEGRVTREMAQTLMDAFNRDGFTDGYYTNRIDQNMFGTRKEPTGDQKWIEQARATYESGEAALVDIKFRATVTVDGSSLSVSDPDGRVCQVQGPVPELARNLPLTGEMLSQRIAKTGGTPFRCVEVRTHIDPGLTLSAAAINGMRRSVLNQLTALRARREDSKIRHPKEILRQKGPKGIPGLTVEITSKDQLTPRLMDLETSMLYVPLHILSEDLKLCQTLAARTHVAAVLPRIVHDGELPHLKQDLLRVREAGVRDVLVGNLGLLLPAREAKMRIHGDFGLNIYNSGAMNFLHDMEFTSTTLSFELTLPQIRDISKAVDAELIIYGRLPLMITEQCLLDNPACRGASRPGQIKLIDKTGSEFPIIQDADTRRSVLLNGRKLSWLDRQKDLSKLGLWAVRLYFTTENSREVDRVIADYLDPTPFDPGACTRGLYLRGVE